jgi:CelD/BcsL family acetyltransferase involved in cellulose biosynthesis/GNAT superfamily N-acetyltransferase
LPPRGSTADAGASVSVPGPRGPAEAATVSASGGADVGLRLAVGDAAWTLLKEPAFIAAWQSLEGKCPWTTPFQRAAFALSWYESYADVATPALVFRRDVTGELHGLFPLALMVSGRLTVAGAEQSEYQGWLAVPDDTRFVVDALDQLASGVVATRLTLQYLPPAIPLHELDQDPRWGGRLFKRSVSRSLMRLDPNETAKTLKKSGNRSKMNRLKQLGEVRLERLTQGADLATAIDEIAAFCDVRQCAISGVMPFLDDPRKKDFHLRMLDHPGLLHATVLRVGERVAAAHLGMAGSRDVALGVIAHSPFLAAHSPGKLLLLLLGDRLASEGFESLDLTPTGMYKERFATHTDSVAVRDIYLQPEAMLKARVVATGRRAAKLAVTGAGRALGISEAQATERARRFGRRFSPGALRHLPRKILTRLSSRWSSRSESLFYRLPAAAARAFEPVSMLSRDSVADLRYYRPAEESDRSRQVFCNDAIERLEAGQHVYTLVENGLLVHYSWVIEEQETSASEFGQPFALEPRSCVLYDDYTHPRARGRGLHKVSLVQRARDAVSLRPIDWVYISVVAENEPSRRNIERLGFQLCASFVREVRFGRTRLT